MEGAASAAAAESPAAAEDEAACAAAEEETAVESAAQQLAAEEPEAQPHAEVEPQAEPGLGESYAFVDESDSDQAVEAAAAQETEAEAYVQKLREAGARVERGDDLPATVLKARKYVDKADKLAEGTALGQLGHAYLNYVRFISLVTHVLPSFEEWEGSDTQRVETKRREVCETQLKQLTPSLVQAFRTAKDQPGDEV